MGQTIITKKTNKIYNQDCIAGMQEIEEKSISIVVTSPPYNLNIQYGTYKDQLPRDSYLLWLGDVFVEIKRILKDDGHFFLNMGYSNIDPWIGIDVANVGRNHFILQNNITWIKSIHVGDKTSGHFKPINSKRFVNPTWEHLFHFTIAGNVEVDKLAAGVAYEWDCNIDKTSRIKGRIAKKLGFKNVKDFNKNAQIAQVAEFEKILAERLKNTKASATHRCRGNSWFIPYDTIANRTKHRGDHPATYPIELVRQCIRLSGINQGLLLDPFMGTGTSAVAAKELGLDYIGFDIDQTYIDYANSRISTI